MKLIPIILLLALSFSLGVLSVIAFQILIREDKQQQQIRENRLKNKEYLTDPTVCRGCGHKHPMVEEIGICGSCASKLYGDSPYLNEM